MVLSSALIGVLSYRSVQARLITEIDRSLVEATNRFLDRPNPSVRFGPRGRVVVTVPERPLGIEQYVVQVTDREGRILAATTGIELPVVDVPSVDRVVVDTVRSADGQSYRMRAVTVDIGSSEMAVVQLARDLSETNNVLEDLRLRVLLIGGAVALVATLSGWVIATGMTRRLRRLSTATEEIASTTRLDIDVPIAGDDEVGRLGRSFRGMLQALSKSKEQQQRLVQDAGHELRTPLTSLRMNVDVLRRHEDLTEEMRTRLLDDLNRDTEELAQLVEEILTLATDPITTAVVAPMERFDLGVLIHDVSERARRRTGRAIEIIGVDTGQSSEVTGQRALIERAVTNLLDNAVKFDRSQATIEVELQGGTITVRDHGPGIPEADLEHVFSRFHRAVEARTLPGSGLGLAIVADVARLHGGSCFARNRVGGGAEVGMTVPVSPDGDSGTTP